MDLKFPDRNHLLPPAANKRATVDEGWFIADMSAAPPPRQSHQSNTRRQKQANSALFLPTSLHPRKYALLLHRS